MFFASCLFLICMICYLVFIGHPFISRNLSHLPSVLWQPNPSVLWNKVTSLTETRQEAKSQLTRAEKTNRPIEEKESFRWIKTIRESTNIIPDDVHFITICDREGDFYELYVEAQELEEDFIIRVTHDRCSDTNEKIFDKIHDRLEIGKITVNIPRDSRKETKAREVEMELACCQVNIAKPARIRNDKIATKITINLVRITEINPLDGNEPIEWILATSLPIKNAEEVMTVVEYYIQPKSPKKITGV